MRRRIYASSDKPRIAKIADNVVTELDKFFQEVEYAENIENVLSEEDMNTLSDAYEILMFVDREMTTVYREQKRRGERY